MYSFLTEQVEQVGRVVASGSQGALHSGCAITKHTHGTQPEVWVRSDTTLIIGCHPDGPEKETEASTVEWTLPIDKSQIATATEAALVVCCERVHGGLHSPRQGATAYVFVNGQQVDLIPLLAIPDGYTDYHHREAHPEYSTISPIRNCNTVYRFSIAVPTLKTQSSVMVRLQLDAQARWDIDYIALIVNYTKRRLRPWVHSVIGAVAGFVAGQLWNLVIPEQTWKSLFHRLGSFIGGP